MAQLHDFGEEFILDYIFEESATKPLSIDVGLYYDATDSLIESDDIDSITTEPTGSNYNRQTVNFGTADFTNAKNSGDWESTIKDLVYNVSDSSGMVDSYFVIINFDSDDAGDAGTASDHIFFTGQLDQEYDLQYLDEFTGSNGGVSIT